jgi:hypothetical protein
LRNSPPPRRSIRGARDDSQPGRHPGRRILPRSRHRRIAAASGLHPELVDRFVTLGLLAPRADEAGDLWFQPGDVATVARIQRLRAGFGLNYAAIGLVLDLLDRLDARGRSGAGGYREPSPTP